MRSVRSIVVHVAVPVAVTVLAPGTVGAAQQQPPLVPPTAPGFVPVAVSSDSGGKPIIASWRTRTPLARGQAYTVTLVTNGFPERGGPPCASGALTRTVGRGAPRGRRIVVRFPVPKVGRWCGSRDAAHVLLDVGGRQIGGTRQGFAILDSRGLLPQQGFWNTFTFAPGSTVTVKVPGRPDRSAPLTAAIEQDTLGPPVFGPQRSTNAGGTLGVGALPADPLCTAAPLAPIAVDPATTTVFPQATYKNDAPLTMTLVLRGTPAALTGCAPETPAPALTAVVISGVSGPDRPSLNTGFPLTGTLEGVRLAGGGVASVVLDARLVIGWPMPAATLG